MNAQDIHQPSIRSDEKLVEHQGSIPALQVEKKFANCLREKIREMDLQGAASLINKKEFILIPLKRHLLDSEQTALTEYCETSGISYSYIFLNEDHESIKLNRTLSQTLQKNSPTSAREPSLPNPNSARRQRHKLKSQRQKEKSNRAIVFVDWMIATFGREVLCSGDGVLDVAGGKGDVAFQLSVIKDIKCTVVDPKRIKLSQNKTKTLFGSIYKGEVLTTEDQIECNNSKLQWLHQEVACQHGLQSSLTAIERLSSMNQFQCLFDDEFINGETSSLWKNISVVVGMHPDEATEPIVDYAITHEKPFAIVPCCVFPNQNQHRFTLEGERVTSYEQFVQYLLRKDPSIQMETLSDMSGRNIVIYRL